MPPLAVACLASLALLLGCSAHPPRGSVSEPGELASRHPRTPAAGESAPGEENDARLAALARPGADDWPGQRTLRLSYDDGGGDVTLYLVWRIASPTRYSLLAKDRLGRSWWSLAVDGRRATSLDLRQQTYCLYQEAVEIVDLPLGPLRFSVLPQLLLGRLPVEAPTWRRRDGDTAAVDELGRLWTVRVAASAEGAEPSAGATGAAGESAGIELAGWSLFERLGDEAPIAWYERQGELSYLSSRSRDGALQLRWKLGRLQELAGDPLPLEPPGGFEVGDCDDGPSNTR
ncbi:MAG: hypothetical protein DWQ36_23290 [Acidobacteria bacterium]|nr:MAG: hypothetical protein DWQ30_21905 [Acidobacteriota bacterium]REK00084.1 MAG: hypothetical protein DWQ36_23290 [Acidobacteriota bacterium]